MSKYEIVSARIDKELKEKLKKYNINVSEIIRKALEDEIIKREREELQKKLEKAGRILKKIGKENIIQMVRETREEA